MKKSLLLLALCLSAFACRAQNTTIVASHISVFGGTPVTGQFCLTPTDGSGNPINVTTTTGQQFTPQTPLCFPIVAGVLSGAAIVPDTSLTQPANVCYALTIKNNFGQIIGSYQCLQPQGGTWSFDSYVPSTLPSIPALQMPQFKVNGTLNAAQTVLDLRGPGVSYSSGGIVNINGVGGGYALYPAQCAGAGAPSWCLTDPAHAGVVPTTPDGWIRAACNSLSTSGIVDLSGLTGNVAATTRGCSTPTRQIFLIQTPSTNLTITETDGDIAFPQDNGSAWIGLGVGQCLVSGRVKLSGSANVTAIVGPAHTDGTQESLTVSGGCFAGAVGATVSQALLYAKNNFANTTFQGNNVFQCNGYCLKVQNGSDIRIFNNWLDASEGVSGIVGQPLLILGSGNGTGFNIGPVEVFNNQIEHAQGTNSAEITVAGDGAGALAGSVHIYGNGIERDTGGTPSTTGISITDCQSCSVNGLAVSGSSGGTDGIKVSQSASGRTQDVQISSILAGGAYTNSLNDAIKPKVFTYSAYPLIDRYVVQPAYDSDSGGTIASVHQTAQTAAISTATLCSTALCPAGQYAVNVSMMETGTACSSATAGSVVPSISWTDSNGTAQTSPVASLLGGLKFATSLTGAFASGTLVVSTNGSAISYSTAYTACTTGTGTYQMDIAVGTPGASIITGPGGISGQAISPSSVTSPIMNGVSVCTAYSGSTPDVKANACISDAIGKANGNTTGKADMTGLTGTTAARINLGDSSGDTVDIVLPCTGALTAGFGTGTEYGFMYYSGAELEGCPVSGLTDRFAFTDNTSSNLYALFGVTIVAANPYYHMKGFNVSNIAGGHATTSGFGMIMDGAAANVVSSDGSTMEYVEVDDSLDTTGSAATLGGAVLMRNGCCSSNWIHSSINAQGGGTPLTFQADNNSYIQGVTISEGSVVDPGPGRPLIACTDTRSTKNSYVTLRSLYHETNLVTTTGNLITSTCSSLIIDKPWVVSNVANNAMQFVSTSTGIVVANPQFISGIGSWTYPVTVLPGQTTDSSGNYGIYTSSTAPSSFGPLTGNGISSNGGTFNAFNAFGGSTLGYELNGGVVVGDATSSGNLLTDSATNDIALINSSGSNKVLIGILANHSTVQITAAGLTATALNVAAARKGTFTCTAGGTITISNTNELASSDVFISLHTAGGTPLVPIMKTVTAGTGFTVLCGASDTSVYNYSISN